MFFSRPHCLLYPELSPSRKLATDMENPLLPQENNLPIVGFPSLLQM